MGFRTRLFFSPECVKHLGSILAAGAFAKDCLRNPNLSKGLWILEFLEPISPLLKAKLFAIQSQTCPRVCLGTVLESAPAQVELTGIVSSWCVGPLVILLSGTQPSP